MKKQKLKEPVFAILTGMEEEFSQIRQMISTPSFLEYAGIEFVSGFLETVPVVAAKTGVGKVNAAITAQILLDEFNAQKLLFVGLAGAINPSLKIGDIVVSREVLYHDVDACVMGFQIGEIPFLGIRYFKAETNLVNVAENAAYTMLARLQKESDIEIIRKLNGNQSAPKVIIGRILTGDQFISKRSLAQKLWVNFKGDCVEMEGAAIAHVAYLNRKPFVVVRAVSDKPKKGGEREFYQFLNTLGPKMIANVAVEIAKHCSYCAVKR